MSTFVFDWKEIGKRAQSVLGRSAAFTGFCRDVLSFAETATTAADNPGSMRSVYIRYLAARLDINLALGACGGECARGLRDDEVLYGMFEILTGTRIDPLSWRIILTGNGIAYITEQTRLEQLLEYRELYNAVDDAFAALKNDFS